MDREKLDENVEAKLLGKLSLFQSYILCFDV